VGAGMRNRGDAVRDLAILLLLFLFFVSQMAAPPFRLRSSNRVLAVSSGANLLTALPRCLLSWNFRSQPLFTRIGLLFQAILALHMPRHTVALVQPARLDQCPGQAQRVPIAAP
jgi:hypothetical protein